LGGRADNYGAGGSGGEAGLVGGDVVDGVGCFGTRVYNNGADELAVEEGFDAEVVVARIAALANRVSFRFVSAFPKTVACQLPVNRTGGSARPSWCSI
jgi:hypothetical protein